MACAQSGGCASASLRSCGRSRSCASCSHSLQAEIAQAERGSSENCDQLRRQSGLDWRADRSESWPMSATNLHPRTKLSDAKQLWRKWCDESDRRHSSWRASGYAYPPPDAVPFPEECRDMECGARTRAGTPCKRRDLFKNGRFKFHGGMSTGPRTREGKKRSAINARKRTP